WWRRQPQTQIAGKAKSRQKAHEAGRSGRNPAGGLSCRAQHQRQRLTAPTPMNNIYLDFEAWLTIAVLVTGVLWALDKWRWAPRRPEQRKANWIVDFARSFFPVLLVVLLLRGF